MKITKKICEAVKIYNDWSYANGHPCMYYSGADYTRGGHGSARWGIFQQGKSFSKDWMDNNAKVFRVYNREMKEPVFEDAKAWMQRVLHVGDLAKTPLGSWMDANYVKARNAQIEQMYKELLEKEKNSG